MRRIILLSLLVLVVPACYPVPAPPLVTRGAPDRTFDALLGLIRDRLAVMHDVARWKWAKKAPVEDPEREAALLKDVAEKGVALGLDPEVTHAFFRAQIEAAKIIQRTDLGRWEADQKGPEGEVPDLAGILRPRIDGLNRELLAALAEAKSLMSGRDATARLRKRSSELLVGEGIDAGVREMAIGPLMDSIR